MPKSGINRRDNMEKGIWIDDKGVWHKISEMPKPFLVNSIRCVRKSLDLIEEVRGEGAENSPDYIELMSKFLELAEEYFSRMHKYHDYSKDIPLEKVKKLEEQKRKSLEAKEFWKIIEFNQKIDREGV